MRRIGTRHRQLDRAPALVLGQTWLVSPQENFRAGVARLGWQAKIFLSATLEDDRIFTGATADNQRLWELGDVFEIFLKEKSREDYLELHVAPCGCRSQLHFPREQALLDLRKGIGRVEDFAVNDALFDFRVRTEVGRWEVFAQIPVSSLGLQLTTLKGRAVFASSSRYEYPDPNAPAVGRDWYFAKRSSLS
jgi:hypothetical protein